MGFFRSHGFGFDNGFDPIVLADFCDDLVGLLSGCSQMNNGARSLCSCPEPVKKG